MPNLKELKNRINSVKSTRKITSAMKMVAASKLRRAQEQATASRPYAETMEAMLKSVSGQIESMETVPKLMAGTGDDKVHLLVIFSADRGLCGAFNSYIVREARRFLQELRENGKQFKIITVGRKAREQLMREYGDYMVGHFTDIGKPQPRFSDADRITSQILQMFEQGDFDTCHVLYNKFQSALVQHVTLSQLIPIPLHEDEVDTLTPANSNADPSDLEKVATPTDQYSSYEFEPDVETILESLLPKNLNVQVFKCLLESAASEHGSRMTAMDNATRNAGDLIKKLTLTYNRERQAYITKEIIEIISGAEAV